MFKIKLLKSIIAGMFIGLGATAFLITNNPIIFTIGIFLVFNFTAHLITGYVPTATYNKTITIKDTLIIAIGNLIGSYLFAIIISFTRIYDKIKPAAETIMRVKLSDNYISIFIMAILCVALIGYGMIGTTKVKGYLGQIVTLIFPTYIFVVMGLEHIVANMFYAGIVFGNNIGKTIPLLLVSLLGNIIGGIMVGYSQRLIENK